MAKRKKRNRGGGVPFNPDVDTGTKRPVTARVAVGDVNDKFSDYPSNGLTPRRLARIFREADEGNVRAQMELFEEMEEKDTHLFSQMQTRKLAVTGLDWEVQPFNEKCYDGLSFFNTAHKVGNATYSNRSNKKLSRESYMEGRSSIMSIKGDKGKSLKLVPDLLVVPPALEETARLILEADQIDGTTNVLKGTAKLHVEPALAEHPEYWFLLCTNRFLKPFIYQLRKKIKFTSLTRDTDENVFMLDEYLYGADGRSNAGYGFWQMAYGSTGEVEAQAQG